MTTFSPRYRATIFAPRSVDETEATVLTPVAGAAHSDECKVATVTGVTGFQPYLMSVKGRHGRIDPISRKTDTGQITLQILDKRVNEGGSNLTRWFTEFMGNTDEVGRLLDLKVFIEENTGSGWTSFFTGRIRNVQLTGRLSFLVQVADMSHKLNERIFVGPPHSSISYAAFPYVLPIGNTVEYAGWSPVSPLTGEVESVDTTVTPNVALLKLDDDSKENPANTVTRFLKDKSDEISERRSTATSDNIVARIEMTSGTLNGTVADAEFLTTTSIRFRRRTSDKIEFIVVEEISGELDIGSLTAGDTFKIQLEWRGPARKEVPLQVGNVHPVEFFRDMLDGKFSTLDGLGDTTFAVGHVETDPEGDTTEGLISGFQDIIDHAGIETMRVQPTEPVRINEYAEEKICQRYDLAYRFNGDGDVVLVDFRTPTDTSGVPVIANDDIEPESNPGWSYSEKDTATRIHFDYIRDEIIDFDELEGEGAPDIPVSRVREEIERLDVLAPLDTVKDYGHHEAKIDASGTRYSHAEAGIFVQWLQEEVVKRLERRGERELLARGRGVHTITLTCRRRTNTSNCFQGNLRLLDIDELPNPATHQRGGQLLCRCISRADIGPRLRLEFVYLGVAAQYAAPTVDSVVKNVDDGQHALDVSVTLNADSTPALVEYSITDPGDTVRPVEGSARWRLAFILTSSTTETIRKLPAGQNIWVRVRSESQAEDSRKVPSDWVLPGRVLLDDYTAPTNLVATPEGNSAKLTWDNPAGQDDLLIVIRNAPDPDPLPDLHALLPAGSTQYIIERLTPDTLYNSEVLYLGENGGTGPAATVQYTTNLTGDTESSEPTGGINRGEAPTEVE